ncbi:ferritin- chloroplastic [Chlorella sorokiniana]|uniref:Ferritin n=1 Tax=Chlorella sorokiniana TaxID=3076 RepID=A0A2P6TNT1_CHLSO|nr:ferritin- chloroplastic [Chlorella sorokiniana]|eukprot:PRW50969.1 ferritin- chloroplastic [Chlorella sorokiniana]
MSGVSAEYDRVCEGCVNADTAAKAFVRTGYDDACEHGVNKMINSYMHQWYISTSMAAYFSNDCVALPGVAKFFKANAARAKTDALQFIDYQNMRGGKVVLASLTMPKSDYSHDKHGDALHAFELMLALNKLNFSKLRDLHKVARETEDPELQDFVNSKLHELALAIREQGTYVCELKRVGTGHGVFHFDRQVAC